MTGNKDTTKDQGGNQTKDMDLAQEEEEEHNMVQETKLQIMVIGTVWCAKREDTTTYLTAPSYQIIFLEVTIS